MGFQVIKIKAAGHTRPEQPALAGLPVAVRVSCWSTPCGWKEVHCHCCPACVRSSLPCVCPGVLRCRTVLPPTPPAAHLPPACGATVQRTMPPSAPVPCPRAASRSIVVPGCMLHASPAAMTQPTPLAPHSSVRPSSHHHHTSSCCAVCTAACTCTTALWGHFTTNRALPALVFCPPAPFRSLTNGAYAPPAMTQPTPLAPQSQSASKSVLQQAVHPG
jgi:hypothetical protein